MTEILLKVALNTIALTLAQIMSLYLLISGYLLYVLVTISTIESFIMI